MNCTRREFLLRISAGSAVGALLAACGPSFSSDGQPIATPRPETGPTNSPKTLESLLPILGLTTSLELARKYNDAGLLTNLISLANGDIRDPQITERLIGTMVTNSDTGRFLRGKPELFPFEQRSLSVGVSLCSDSRCNLINSQLNLKDLDEFLPSAAIDSEIKHTLGASPQLFGNVGESMLVTHGPKCGALAGLKEILEEGGEERLLKEGITQQTIDLIKNTLTDADPKAQSLIAARAQAEINALKYGEHTTWAFYFDHVNQKYESLGKGYFAYRGINNNGAQTTFVQEITGDNLMPWKTQQVYQAQLLKVSSPDLKLMKQSPFEFMINTSGVGADQIFGPRAVMPGEMFKVTSITKPDGTIQYSDMIASTDYPQAHAWGKIQYIVTKTEQESAQIRDLFLKNSKTQEWLKNGGVLVEVVVDNEGKMTVPFKITGQPKSFSASVVAIFEKNNQDKLPAFITRTALSAEKFKPVDPKTLTQVLISVKNKTVLLELSPTELTMLKNETQALELLKNKGLISAFTTGEKVLGVASKVFTYAMLPILAYQGINEAGQIFGFGPETIIGGKSFFLPSLKTSNPELFKSINELLTGPLGANTYEGLPWIPIGKIMDGVDYDEEQLKYLVALGLKNSNLMNGLFGQSLGQLFSGLMTDAWSRSFFEMSNPYLNPDKLLKSELIHALIIDNTGLQKVPFLADGNDLPTGLSVQLLPIDNKYHQAPANGDRLIFGYQNRNDVNKVLFEFKDGSWFYTKDSTTGLAFMFQLAAQGNIINVYMAMMIDPDKGITVFPYAFEINPPKP